VLVVRRGTATAPVDNPATILRHRDDPRHDPHHPGPESNPTSSSCRRANPVEASPPSAPVTLPRRGHPECPPTDTTRNLLSRSYDLESRNKIVSTDLGWSREVWGQLADVGILGLGLDPAEAGQIEIMLVLEEVGRRLAPEPVVQAALGPGAIIAEWGTTGQKQLLDEVAAGQRLLAFAHSEPGVRSATDLRTTRVVQQGNSWVLSGRKNPVLAGHCADNLVVSATLPAGGTGLFLVEADAVTRHPYQTFDGHRGAQIDPDLQ